MRTQPAFLLLGALLFAPTLLLLHAQHPGRAMRPFGSDAELLQYLAVIDRARPSRQAPADRTCSDTTRLKPGDKQVVITGRVSDTAGYAIANAQVYAVGRCTTSGADGKYRLGLPDGALGIGPGCGLPPRSSGIARPSATSPSAAGRPVRTSS